MKKLINAESPSLEGLIDGFRRFRLILACILIVLCFAIGNDLYAARTVAQRHKDLINGSRRNVDYSAVLKQKMLEKPFRSDLANRYVIDPKASKQRNLLSILGREADTCNQITSFINSLPFSENGTTAGTTDNYDLSGDPTACPSPTCEATSGSFPDRGYTYAGTGTGPDVAYSIAFIQPTTLKIVVDPTDVGTAQNPIGDDLAIIVYTAGCSNNPSDAVVVADNAGDGNPPDLPDNSETVTFTLMPAGAYNIVVDGYTSASAQTPTAGPYSISVSCLQTGPCSIPAYRRRAR